MGSLPCRAWVAVVAAAVLAGGCSRPMGADKVSMRKAYDQLELSALTSNSYSSRSRIVLHRYDLKDAFDRDPEAALERLHGIACSDERNDILFALADLSYLHAERLMRSFWPSRRGRARDHYLSACIYAYLYVVAASGDDVPDAFDRLHRTAADLYNRGLAKGLRMAGERDGRVDLRGGTRQLPRGPVMVRFGLQSPTLHPSDFRAFYPADQYSIRGLTVRNRIDGLGAPLIGVGKEHGDERHYLTVPATVFLRVTGDVTAWSRGALTATLELYSPFDQNSLQVAGQPVPLEADTTAPIAYALNDDFVWNLGWDQFFSGVELVKSGLYSMQPYQPGRMQVIFVHGTLSSPVWWAEMWNTLRADKVLRSRAQFWNFVYTSGNPISLSAGKLRTSILETVERLDSEGKDSGLQNIVVIGHSQGGLLTRMTATEVGDRLWRVVTDKNLDELEIPDKKREELRRAYFYPPLPCVKRLVFLSTPHRGSYRVGSFVRRLARMFMSIPAKAFDLSVKALQYPFLGEGGNLPSFQTSIDGMSPNNKYLLAVVDAPFPPGVRAHSIIAIKGKEQPPEGSDGVVTYRSAHLSHVDSELVVRGGHSSQMNPTAIEEVRRILLEHLATLPKADPQQKKP
jgi:pimeloyl-ACP methyl ester carboxylesterase